MNITIHIKVPSTCQQNNYDTCRDVQKQKLVQVREKMLPLPIVVVCFFISLPYP